MISEKSFLSFSLGITSHLGELTAAILHVEKGTLPPLQPVNDKCLSSRHGKR